MNGGPLTLTGPSKATVVNLGKIGSSNGDVFLVAAKEVDNLGSITAPNGTAELAAGERVLLRDSSSSQQVFVQLGSKGAVLDRGSIEAAQVSLRAADGNVYALSGNHDILRATGTATRDGHIWLVADTGGAVSLANQIVARNADGSGGIVDTIAGHVAFCHCTPTVSAGIWNIATPSFTLTNIAANSFARSLNAGTSINLQTTGGKSSTGDIDVASSIAWSGAASLNFDAYHTVRVDRGVTIKNQGSGNLTLRADSTAIDNGGSATNLGTIDWSKSTGIVQAFHDPAAAGGGYTPGTQLTNAAWTPAAHGPVLTQSTGYQWVNNLTDLQSINENLSGTYALGRDIDASATSDGSFVSLGNGTTAFSGLFDGMGHQITSLTLTQAVPYIWLPFLSVNTAEGLFGNIGSGALVRDFSVSGTALATNAKGVYGILAGNNSGTIENVSTSGRVFGPSGAIGAGGLVGLNQGNLWHTSSSVSVGGATGDWSFVGGLVGMNEAIVAQSYATGSINSSDGGAAAGGLVGTNDKSITQSYATGSVNVSGLSHFAGGLVGDNTSPGSIAQSYATGAVSANDGIPGGLVGNNSGSVVQSFATGVVSSPGGYPTGGIAGDEYPGAIGNDVYWNAQTTGSTVAVGMNPYSYPEPPATNGLTTAQMMMSSSFVGYDFGSNGVWAMPVGSTHPVLAWQVSSGDAK